MVWHNRRAQLVALALAASAMTGCGGGTGSTNAIPAAPQSSARSTTDFVGGPGFNAMMAVPVSASGASGRVVNVAGNPVATALVEAVKAGGATVAKAVTGADGSFNLSLSAGTYTLVVRNAYVSSRASGSVQVTVTAGSIAAVGTLID